MPRTLINIPPTAPHGAEIPIRILIAHPMEPGVRRDADGRPIPRNIINRLTCTYNGALVIDADLQPAIAANPFFAFSARADQSGEILLTWTDDTGATQTERRQITVTP